MTIADSCKIDLPVMKIVLRVSLWVMHLHLSNMFIIRIIPHNPAIATTV
jgi:hypothetical protein